MATFNKAVLGALLGALWVAGAAAWAEPLLVVHPLEVEGMNSAHWNELLMREVAKQKVAVMPEALVQALLRPYGGSCKGDMKCLKALSRGASDAYVLEVKVSELTAYVASAPKVPAGNMLLQEKVLKPTKLYVADARVLRVDGTVLEEVGPLQVVPVSETDEEANAMAVYAWLFVRLKLGNLPPHPRLGPPPPPSLPMPKPVLDERLRTASYALLGTSAAAAVVGAVCLHASNNNAKGLLEKVEIWQNLNSNERKRVNNLLIKSATYQAIALSAFAITYTAGLLGGMLFIDSKRYAQQSIDKGLIPPAPDKHLRTISYFLLGASAISLGAGAVITGSSYLYTASYFGFGLITAGTVVGVAGFLLFFASSERQANPPLSLGFMPTQGGALLSFQGRFP